MTTYSFKSFEYHKWGDFYQKVSEASSRYNDKPNYDNCNVSEYSYGKTAIQFFRGHTSKEYKLIPCIFRGKKAKDLEYLEQSLYYEFCTNAGTMLTEFTNSWDIAFAMQHYGIPTRFLDWTESFAVALYFAIKQEDVDQKEAIIWMLDPYALNKKSYRINKKLNYKNDDYMDEILDLNADLESDYFNYFVLNKRDLAYPDNPPKIDKDIYAIYPRRRTNRMHAQMGIFTLHNTKEALEEKHPSCVTRFILKSSGFQEARLFLRLAGVNQYTLFPDLSNLGQYLKSLHNI